MAVINATEIHSVFHCWGWKGKWIISCIWHYPFHGHSQWDSIALIYWELEHLEEQN